MKKFFFFIIPLIIFLLILFIYFKGNLFIENFINFIDQNKDNFIIILAVNIIYCLLSLPVTPLIIVNGFFLGIVGFYNFYIAIIFSSILIFYFTRLYSKRLEKNAFFKKKILNNSIIKKFRNVSSKSYIFLVLRYSLPVYPHNLFYGITKISFFKFCYLLILSEIPLTYALIMIGVSLNDLILHDLDLISVFYSMNFLLPFSLIVLVIIFTNLIRKKF
jgi:uncharacterized membrane protein YdjX (TVP38/TMEM64 family)